MSFKIEVKPQIKKCGNCGYDDFFILQGHDDKDNLFLFSITCDRCGWQKTIFDSDKEILDTSGNNTDNIKFIHSDSFEDDEKVDVLVSKDGCSL